MIELELNLLEEKIYNICNLKISNVIHQIESKEYFACSFYLNENKIIFRKGKITPKKTGQFVAFWKRSDLGPIEPYFEHDDFDFFIVNCSSEDNFGQFIFPKKILTQKGIISTDNKEGKRAFRVYPTWEKTTNKQAEKTQSWQKDYFVLFTNNIDFKLVKRLYLK
ncbi:MepB family protein [Flavobacterium sp. N2270]|uniref:MepB family protein n=1 Tax=Flavobacterium sp. N2270 TaxID=2986831 RepID=UPI002224A818|nr:MepB family protein [Flavobacterium sp. N2270]